MRGVLAAETPQRRERSARLALLSLPCMNQCGLPVTRVTVEDGQVRGGRVSPVQPDAPGRDDPPGLFQVQVAAHGGGRQVEASPTAV
jgi:hypothetical protein